MIFEVPALFALDALIVRLTTSAFSFLFRLDHGVDFLTTDFLTLSHTRLKRVLKRKAGPIGPADDDRGSSALLSAAYFEGRCRIPASACSRFESASLFVFAALSFSDGVKLLSFAISFGFKPELSAL